MAAPTTKSGLPQTIKVRVSGNEISSSHYRLATAT
jgi:hypothetical protein